MHAYVAGKGNPIPIMAMHGDGTGLNYLNWLPCATKFAAESDNRYAFYSLSMPGYGKSTGKQSSFRNHGTEVLSQILQFLKFPKAVIMGRSVGGRTSIEFANKHP